MQPFGRAACHLKDHIDVQTGLAPGLSKGRALAITYRSRRPNLGEVATALLVQKYIWSKVHGLKEGDQENMLQSRNVDLHGS